uniref:phenylalanine 4-monooxygenase n=1 Tax=Panagrolaimus superbus TaxID=310955 RepID=A0A914Z658_9BILA
MESFVAEVSTNPANTTIIFTLKETPGALAETLRIFKDKKVNLSHIESRPSKNKEGCYEILVEVDESADKDRVEEIISLYKRKAENIHVQDFNTQVKQNKESVPWFPMKMKDIDQFANRVLSYGAELDSDHPGFTDPIYRERRKQFADIAANYHIPE